MVERQQKLGAHEEETLASLRQQIEDANAKGD
jgi:hypothetical protein